MLKAGSRLGPYEVVAAIGAGGMGEVYRAHDTRLGRDVAIKVLPSDFAAEPERLRRFEREARATAALSHPNLLAVYDVGTHDGAPYLVEELLHGQSLKDRLERGAMPVAEAIEVAVQMAHGLAEAHAKHIIHRDLKPANVFITNEGIVKILDFGLAKLVEGMPIAETDTLTQPPTGTTELGRVLGTLAYMAPEQARGLPVDPRADIFSFGVVLYEMLARRHPFRGESSVDTVAAIIEGEPPPLPGNVPAALKGLVRQCLEKLPERRFSSGHDLALALQAAVTSSGVARDGDTMSTGRTTAGRRRLALAGGLVALAAVGAALLNWRPWSTTAPTAAAARQRLVALPCKVYGAPEVAFLTDAVPGTISTLLAQVEGLDTKVPPTSLEVEKVKGDLATLAELYDVSSFIVTSINTSPAGFALNVQLVDAATMKVRWGRQYEGAREAYNDLARQAADGIRLAVRPAAAPVPTSTASSEAELALREGEYFFNRHANLGDPANFESSRAAFERALELEPSLAAAATGFANLWISRFQAEGDAHDARREAEAWARRALGLDPRCGRAWSALSALELSARHADPERGLDFAVKGVAFDPRSAWTHTMLGIWAYNGGSISLGVTASLRAVELDPFVLAPAGNAAFMLDVLGRRAEALAVLDRALRVEPEWLFGTITKGGVLTSLGRLEEAEGLLRGCERAVEDINLLDEMWRETRLTLAVAKGDSATSEALVAQILATILDPKADAMLIANAAGGVPQALARMGRTDDALRILDRSVEAGVPPAYDWLRLEPAFQPLRADPRFERVLAASRGSAAATSRVLELARGRGELPPYLEGPLDELQRLLGDDRSRN